MISRLVLRCLALGFALWVPMACAQNQTSVQQHALELAEQAKRIVALELSFVDSLAVLGISPIGIADDNNPNILLPEVKARIAPWVSLGLRAQPNLEQIAALKPDLIIADSERHRAAYDGLAKIAPTLLLKSRGETYQENLVTAQQIAQAVGREPLMAQRLAEHKRTMTQYREKLAPYANQATIQFAIASARGVWLHGPTSYAAGVLDTLGFPSSMAASPDAPYVQTSLEMLLSLNPDWLLIGAYGEHTALDDWRETPLFSVLSAVQQQQVVPVSPALWSLNRGILAAEGIAADLERILQQ
ncbi:Fe(3+)-citrate-binding protein YfmC precursor [Marinomonas aquimarina]|uniref:Fe(3+)-citrate-binding protein YfmC n=1 Tax=Marinomonas aquimarina TaxID=295068 RepID=A0A1A8TDB0_9GAMM|nr:Fe(3+) dicitrate ABC transporter substrate-binding protein [Marinomonas aquimarina]SBS30793.1 Fe(3+)-citrate-binding protein YfmC precursor [Marinomonas aquimarina]